MKSECKKTTKISMKKVFSVLCTGIIAFSSLAVSPIYSAADSTDEYERQEIKEDIISYSDYRKGQSSEVYPTDEIVLSAETAELPPGNIQSKSVTDWEGNKGKSVFQSENEDITWRFFCRSEGYYILEFEYYTVSGGGDSIKRSISIDGKIPFREAGALYLSRLWKNSDKKTQYDTQGNQIMVEQTEVPSWTKQYACDPAGLADGPFCFYLTEGKHTLTLSAETEPAVFKALKLKSVSETAVVSYADVSKKYGAYKDVSEKTEIKLQAENADLKSDRTLYPLADKTSPTVEPYSFSKIVYNTIGSNQWTNAGQWLEWNFEVKESGLYVITAHFKQSLKENRASVRELQIDGKTPFGEAENWMFPYDGAWQTQRFGKEDGEPYKLYLEKGKHTLRLTVGNGEYKEIISSAKEYLSQLNGIYRSVVSVSGTSPDQNRDYRFEKMIPETIEQMKQVSKELKVLENSVRKIDDSGKTVPDIKRIYDQLDLMTEDTDTVAARLSAFKNNIASYGTWINKQAGQPLELDWIKFSSVNSGTENGEAGFFGLAAHYIKQFFSSFVTDYTTIGQTETKASKSIKVWMTTNRDQAQILRNLILADFTPESDISVELQLVASTALLPAVLANKAPDVSLGMLQADPLNLALRGAVYDLNNFDDINDFKSAFYAETLIPFEFNGGLYALPETLTFPMLFYRSDILRELDIHISELENWSILLGTVLPKLQKNSLEFGVMPTIQNYLTFCYQQGGDMYSVSGTESALGSSAAIESMKLFCMLYSQYGVPVSYDFANRFRTGEMPLAVADFTAYNTLAIFAPEIDGLWGMVPVPGTADKDGKTNFTTVSTVTASAIMNGSKDPNAAWSFMKWWLSAETQNSFGKNLESVVGASARYNTANREALYNVKWDSDVKKAIIEQSKHIKAYREVPGGYFTARLFNFAYRKIVYDDGDIRENMNDTVADINRELSNKRKEYGLK